ncbi:MAG: MarR family transcriptional regulator [Thermoproteota archaeon]|nr:MarR family transcriptional regulator [Thermoproteota archaeon]
MLVEIPDVSIILFVILAFVGGVVTLYLSTKLRSSPNPTIPGPASINRLEYYENQLIDMKIRLDAMELDTENSEVPNFDKVNEELAKPQKRKQEVGSMEIKSQGTSRIPNMSFEDSIEHVLKLITKKPMTSRDIEVTFGGRSREHVSRLMKKLYDDGFVERNTTKRPYTYSITDSGKARIGSKENVVYAVSQ